MIKNDTIKRTVFALVFVAVALPAFILTSYAGVIGKSIGAALFIIIGCIGMYEVFTLMNMEKTTAIIMSSVLIVVFFLPWDTGVKKFFISQWNDVKGGVKNIHPLNGVEQISRPLKDALSIAFKDWKPWVITSAYLVVPYFIDSNFRKNPNLIKNFVFLLIALFLIPTFAKSLWVLTIVNIGYSIFFIFIPIISDSMGYFGGMLFGKEMFKGKKLAPKISPKKTWAGFIIGLFFSLIFAIVGGYFVGVWDASFSSIGSSILAGIILSLVSPLGDLLFSLIKRSYNKKDFSNLIPGHGGIFDRLDSTAFVIVVAIILIVIL